MCGRFSEPNNSAYLNYNLTLPDNYEPSFNVSPGSLNPIITKNSPLTLKFAKWGLIPSWSKNFKSTFATFNARKEGLLTSKIYKRPFLTQRCLVLSQAFYEWRTLSDGEKIRYVVRPKDRDFFSFPGLFDVWKDAEEKEFYSFTIVTDEPTPSFKAIHSREACILDQKEEDTWLDSNSNQDQLLKVLHPCKEKEIEFFPAKVNKISSSIDSAELLDPKN